MRFQSRIVHQETRAENVGVQSRGEDERRGKRIDRVGSRDLDGTIERVQNKLFVEGASASLNLSLIAYLESPFGLSDSSTTARLAETRQEQKRLHDRFQVTSAKRQFPSRSIKPSSPVALPLVHSIELARSSDRKGVRAPSSSPSRRRSSTRTKRTRNPCTNQSLDPFRRRY